MKVRVSQHQGLSPGTGKHLKETLSTSVRDHILDCNHVVAWDDIKVLGRESSHWLLEIKESLFIKRDRPSLNKNIYFQFKALYFCKLFLKLVHESDFLYKSDKYTLYKLTLTLYKNKNRLNRYKLKLLPYTSKVFRLTYKTFCQRERKK